MSVDPRYIPTFVEWSDFMYPDLEEYGPIMQASSENDWKNWGSSLLSLDGIAALAAPSPYEFSDWKEWAMRFVEALDQGV